VFVAGAAVQWLRDGLRLISRSSEIEELAATEPDAGGVYFVPAFVGLGAPYWDPYARGVMVGLTRGTTRGHIARATLEAMGFQTRDVIEAMEADAGITLSTLKVDGGAAINNGLMQFQADILGRQVERPVVYETTALGAGYLAGLAVGFWDSSEAIRTRWALDRAFAPQMPEPERERRYRLWQKAVTRARGWEEEE
jgi:glycerol kinase